VESALSFGARPGRFKFIQPPALSELLDATGGRREWYAAFDASRDEADDSSTRRPFIWPFRAGKVMLVGTLKDGPILNSMPPRPPQKGLTLKMVRRMEKIHTTSH
jgi:hypothetical protein